MNDDVETITLSPDLVDVAETGTSVAMPPEPDTLKSIFSTGEKGDAAMNAMLDAIEKSVMAEVADVSTAAGRRRIIALASKVSSSRTLVEDYGKRLGDGYRAHLKAISERRNLAKDRLADIRDKRRKPVTDWEAEDDARKRRHEAAIKELEQDGEQAQGRPSAEIKATIERIDALVVDESWDEYREGGEEAKVYALRQLRQHLAAAEVAENQAAELEQLRAEKAKRDEADRKAAEEKAAADAKAAQEAAEAKRVEEALAESKRQQEADAQAAKEAVEKAEREAAEAKERAAAAEAEAKRQAAEAEAARKQAEADAVERQQQQAAAKAEADRQAEAARRKDAEHRKTVMDRAIADLSADPAISARAAKRAVELIATDAISSISMKF